MAISLPLLLSLLGPPISVLGMRPFWTLPATQPTGATKPAEELVSREMAARVERLVRQLASPDYREREAAQRQLAKLGEAAMLPLVDHATSPDLEVAERISALIVRPDDPRVRVEVAYRLLASGRSYLMEPAVYMLFEDPLTDFDRFEARCAGAKGLARASCGPVLEQLRDWKRQTEIFRANYARFLETKPEAAEQQAKMHKETTVYQAEAAYWAAVESVEAYYAPPEATQTPTSAPASGARVP